MPCHLSSLHRFVPLVTLGVRPFLCVTQTHAFVASPEMVVATAIAGDITFNPESDTIPTPGGAPFKFDAPFGKELPPKGFDPGEDTFQVSNGWDEDEETLVKCWSNQELNAEE